MKKIKAREFSGTTEKEPREYEKKHRILARRAAAEGMVLLKNENHLLPVSINSKIALFGTGAVRTVKGGTGSGDVNERDTVSIYDGLRQEGFEITNTEWLEKCEAEYEENRNKWKIQIQNLAGDDPMRLFDMYSRHPFPIPDGPKVEKTDTDTAIFVLCRNAGEEKDRMEEKGDYYLTDGEEEQLDDICKFYKKVIVLLNTGGVVDVSFLDKYPQIHSVLYISQPGMEGGNAVADVISGAVTPCGKLTDTWAYHYHDYPNAQTFSYKNGNTEQEYYKEGIYVGYRYFDSFQVPVRYGFGYGLSYTSFQADIQKICINDTGKETKIEVAVCVTNDGNTYSGREVVQVYASLPSGESEKEYRRLCGFAKTKLLAPGEKQNLLVSFAIENLSSFDSHRSAWVLEKGDYVIWTGTSLSDTRIVGILQVEKEQILQETEAICPLKEEIAELSLDKKIRLIRFAELIRKIQEQNLQVVKLDSLKQLNLRKAYSDIRGNYEKEKEIVGQLTVEQMINLATGKSGNSSGNNLGAAGISVPGSAGETSSCAEDNGIASIVLADGPAGLRLTQVYYVKDGMPVPVSFEQTFEHGFFAKKCKEDGTPYYQYCTAFPVGTLLAQTWDLELVYEIGTAVAEEMKLMGVDLWLAPGMNLHRNPLCGRNFEYYSEDPLLTGKIAASMVKGVQSISGCGTTIKHFACNNQEENRMHSDSILSERVLREIYLKGFEIAVREASPRAVMTSYNLINGVHAANSYDLCTQVLRKEWGFEGMVMTDWTTTEHGDDCTAAGCMRAGNDLIMPGKYTDRENIKESLENGTLSEEELKKCIIRTVRVIRQSGQYEENEI